MIHFEWLWLLAALPLPWLAHLLPPIIQHNQAALRVPFIEDFQSDTPEKRIINAKSWPFYLAIIAWCCLIIAGIRPQWLGEPVEMAITGRDLMMAVDLSRSMEEQDFLIQQKPVDRLTATQAVASQFIKRRAGDRIGLILFGSQAYLQTPLTFDRQTVMTLLNEAAIGLAGESTSIGDAIGLAVKRLRSQPSNSRVLILMTDGANTAGVISPLKAADLAAENQLKIYTIGIGADEMIVRSLFGNRRVNPSRDLDEKTLTAIANKTGGQYFRARNTDEFNTIYALLDELEPIEKDKQFFRPKTELYAWPLGLSLFLMLLIVILKIKEH
ncbi:MAG TPA: VWA domain-containing protein [Methylococcaceae bacterium]|nr:VWA domain-containing protein [Methylococcaceae bacterium]HIB62401.1 VWA domain-containing protein [Methylococcaceae bacterium]HIN68208.1 VWA domain-containing protein [Methylococcales bacterium]